jgi:YbgC/YbaW family acyl-CoA thioester hydrolase
MSKALSHYPIQVRQPVVWGELDPNGHVNNIWYFRYVENARTTLYAHIGKYDEDAAEGVTFVVASTRCRFKTPLAFGDAVITGARIDSIGADRVFSSYRIVREADDAIAAEADATLVCYDPRRHAKTAIPGRLRAKLDALREASGDASNAPDASAPAPSNLFDEAAPPHAAERFDTLLRHRNLLIERIVSSAAAPPRRYVQPQDEWVLMLRGEAALALDGKPLRLASGDHAFLPAGTPHTVERVSEGALWLAVHLFPEEPAAR